MANTNEAHQKWLLDGRKKLKRRRGKGEELLKTKGNVVDWCSPIDKSYLDGPNLPEIKLSP